MLIRYLVVILPNKELREMDRQTIDTYKLTSMEEPCDEILSQLMKEAANEAKETWENVQSSFFSKLRTDAILAKQQWFHNNPEMAVCRQ